MKNFIVHLFLFVFMFTGFGCGSKQEQKSPDAWKHEDNWTMAYIMMEEYVKQRLKAPSTAEFPGVFDGMKDHVKSHGNQKYRIISYVDVRIKGPGSHLI